MLSFSVVSASPLWGLEWERAMMLFHGGLRSEFDLG